MYLAPATTTTTISTHVTCAVPLRHSACDLQVPLSDAGELYRNRKTERVRLRILPDSGHSPVEKIRNYESEVVAFLDQNTGLHR
jgi:hypothetical protein